MSIRRFAWARLLICLCIVLKRIDFTSAADQPANITFSNWHEEDVHMYWVQRGTWLPPAAPRNSSDAVSVRCQVGRRESPHPDDVYNLSREQQLVFLKRELQDRGEFVITVRKDWAPLGSERFLELVKAGFFDGSCLFRAVQGFLVQFGVSSDEKLQQEWGHNYMADDPLRPELLPLPHGTLAFAGGGNHSRSTHLWLSFKAGAAGKERWETPVGYVHPRAGMDVVDSINTQYGDLANFGGHAPDTAQIESESGLEYLRKNFPNIDYLKSCSIVANYTPPKESRTNEYSRLVDIGSIPPGGRSEHKTYIGHQFVAKLGGAKGLQVGAFEVTEESSHHDIVDHLEM